MAKRILGWLWVLALCSACAGCSGTIGTHGADAGEPVDGTVSDGEDGAGGDAAGDAGGDPGGDAGGDGDVELVTRLSDHGVTWTFSEPVRWGRFVTGDFWVLGPVTVIAIDPPPGDGRNGSVLNIPPSQSQSGFDDRTPGNRFEASLVARPPIALVPGDSLASSISVESPGQVDNWLREGNGERSESPVWSVSILTCLDEPAPTDAFRPSYADSSNRIYRLSDLDRDRLPRLAAPQSVDTDYIRMFAERLARPWVDNLFYAFDAQVAYMAMYGREQGRVAGIASLLLMLDLPAEQQAVKEQLLVGYVQHGIDLWGLVRAGHAGWYAHGGHGSGRKWPIIFSGLLLGDAEMASPTLTYPDVQFGEDMHTAFADGPPWGPAWIGATVIYTGHMGIWRGEVVSDTPGWGPYEHLPPDEWEGDGIGEGYRRCCTSLAWVGQALAARLMDAQESWAHDAFFAYADRWMDPSGDEAYTQTIYEMSGLDFRANFQRQGQAWDDLVEAMWAAYR
ncbi:MAG: hypothetical protein JXR96_09635 [Deltaproteobacteria bacterium]|nr:hypothetical protein [Deltaproteobacteria bacterium]